MEEVIDYEHNKLDTIDRKAALWLNSQCPGELYNFLNFVADHNYQRKGIKLDVSKAHQELSESAKFGIYRKMTYIIK